MQWDLLLICVYKINFFCCFLFWELRARKTKKNIFFQFMKIVNICLHITLMMTALWAMLTRRRRMPLGRVFIVEQKIKKNEVIWSGNKYKNYLKQHKKWWKMISNWYLKWRRMKLISKSFKRVQGIWF